VAGLLDREDIMIGTIRDRLSFLVAARNDVARTNQAKFSIGPAVLGIAAII
jgi:hypothetical protein